MRTLARRDEFTQGEALRGVHGPASSVSRKCSPRAGTKEGGVSPRPLTSAEPDALSALVAVRDVACSGGAFGLRALLPEGFATFIGRVRGATRWAGRGGSPGLAENGPDALTHTARSYPPADIFAPESLSR